MTIVRRHARSGSATNTAPAVGRRPPHPRGVAVSMAASSQHIADRDTSRTRVVICGGGIMGAATAYYLAQFGVAATVVERETVAAAASGKAGGFLALDWLDGSPTGSLARHSYSLHQQLADTLGRDALGYREVDTLQVRGHASGAGSNRLRQVPPPWLDGSVTACSRLGSKATTAQVHPQKLTTALMAAAEAAAGARVVHGTVCGILRRADGAATAVRVQLRHQKQQQQQQPAQGSVEDLPADVVVLAMGPWTGAARAWLPSAPATSGQKYHSVVLRPQQPVDASMIFTSFRTADGRDVEPELYPRPDETVYVCGEPQSLPVPPGGPADVDVVETSCDTLRNIAGSLASCLRDAPVELRQSCFLPLTDDGEPAIGRVPGTAGTVLVATGHSCWGILNGPATGQAVAELIVHGEARSVDLTPFDPARLCTSGIC